MNKQKGFTVIELIAAIVLLFTAGTLIVLQKQDIETSHRDSDRKTSINAIYHHLEEIYYPANKAYPEQIDTTTIKGISPELLQDPSGTAINQPDSTLRYEPTNCRDGKCQNYTLRADLEKEADFIKESRN